jgi:hypothetical protein
MSQLEPSLVHNATMAATSSALASVVRAPQVCISQHARTHARTHARARTHTHTHMHMHACMHAHTHTHTHTGSSGPCVSACGVVG